MHLPILFLPLLAPFLIHATPLPQLTTLLPWYSYPTPTYGTPTGTPIGTPPPAPTLYFVHTIIGGPIGTPTFLKRAIDIGVPLPAPDPTAPGTDNPPIAPAPTAIGTGGPPVAPDLTATGVDGPPIAPGPTAIGVPPVPTGVDGVPVAPDLTAVDTAIGSPPPPLPLSSKELVGRTGGPCF
ncbi:hypothetical protein MMC30_008242 [Trapelia coarctata]|nr:hypothetical protein [Trapelia coarctata]